MRYARNRLHCACERRNASMAASSSRTARCNCATVSASGGMSPSPSACAQDRRAVVLCAGLLLRLMVRHLCLHRTFHCRWQPVRRPHVTFPMPALGEKPDGFASKCRSPARYRRVNPRSVRSADAHRPAIPGYRSTGATGSPALFARRSVFARFCKSVCRCFTFRFAFRFTCRLACGFFCGFA